jgi:hypothetical protein
VDGVNCNVRIELTASPIRRFLSRLPSPVVLAALAVLRENVFSKVFFISSRSRTRESRNACSVLSIAVSSCLVG